MPTYYISPSGNDTTGNGSQGNPWATYSKFFTSSVAGDVCVMAAGTYTFSGGLTLTDRAIIGAPLANNSPTTIFDGGGATVTTSPINGTVSISNVRFTNFVGPSTSNVGIFGFSNNLSIIKSITWSYCQFDNIRFQVANQNGVFLSHNSQQGPCSMSWTNCLFYDIICTTNPSNDSAIFAFSSTTGIHNLSWTNCTIRVAQTTTNTQRLFFLQSAANFRATFRNCIIVDYGTLNPSFQLTATSIQPATANNLIFGYSSIPTMTGTITADPLFIDPAGGNFGLRPTSPAIDAGVLI